MTTHSAIARLTVWLQSKSYTSQAIETFLLAADSYLVAQALAGGHAVVTHEVRSESTRKIKIPDVCIGLGIEYRTPFEMLRREKAQFVLGAAA